ncbi:MAG: 2-phospho-L-lactate transferase CofD family protein, partial [Candidatus Pacebacteria bacterium]|nr:2-phospho-L-lactate transferase CofD family protein [Candidatus Paceibacterota bacterium]
TSIIPNLLVRGIPEAIKKSKAKKIYVCNLMTKFGETNNFYAKDFIYEIENYLGENILDYIILNNKIPPSKFLFKYRKARAKMVRYKDHDFQQKNHYKVKIIKANVIRMGDFIRHDPKKIAKIIYSLK